MCSNHMDFLCWWPQSWMQHYMRGLTSAMWSGESQKRKCENCMWRQVWLMRPNKLLLFSEFTNNETNILKNLGRGYLRRCCLWQQEAEQNYKPPMEFLSIQQWLSVHILTGWTDPVTDWSVWVSSFECKTNPELSSFLCASSAMVLVMPKLCTVLLCWSPSSQVVWS